MCGIAGVLYFDGTHAQADLLKRMADSIAHRGPDGEGFYLDGPLGLGHRRLAIIDLSPAGVQPMSNEDKTVWVTFNGEVYNFAEVRRELERRGHSFRSATDTEVIVHAYEEWGTECLERLNGMFAFGLWDARRRRLFLARDRLGIKPLFYYADGRRLLFASEIKAILADETIERRVNLKALHHFLSLNYTPAPLTLFAGISQLMPGHYLLCDGEGRVTDGEYWDVHYIEEGYRPEAEYVERFGQLLQEAVRRQLVSDVPFGAFLSGGVDSSSVVYWMSQYLENPVQTFSIGFAEKSYNELYYTRITARHCRTQHHERVVTPDTVEILPKIVWHAEEPTADSSMIPMYYLAQLTREHVTMALGGDGADEILAGYQTYQAYYATRIYRLLPGHIRRWIIAPLVDRLPVSGAKVSLDFRLKRFVRGAELDYERGHAYWRIVFDEEAKRLLYAPHVREVLERDGGEVFDLYEPYFEKTTARHPLNRRLYVDTRFFLPNDGLVKVDRMTMAHGLEARVPFLDHELVEFLATVPPGLKLRGPRLEKYLLKLALKDKLPREILFRKKQGFNLPKVVWLKGQLGDFALDTLSPRVISDMGLFEPVQVARLLQEHFSGRRDNSHQIWGLLVLVTWWHLFIQPSPEPPGISMRLSSKAVV
jgi:asparagine synthase (glutamine-hydrolysing)